MTTFTGKMRWNPFTHKVVEFDDNWNGSSSSDTYNSGGGNDTIYTGGGNDTVHAGSGDDWIAANKNEASYDQALRVSGTDHVFGEAGNDTIAYTFSDDDQFLYGDGKVAAAGDGRDEVYGGRGNDLIVGGGAKDKLFGNGGHDTIFGDFEDGTGNGNDEIEAGSGNDNVFGGAGNDHIWGDTGQDTLRGGSGGDFFHYNKGDSNLSWTAADLIVDFKSGTDKIVFDAQDVKPIMDLGSFKASDFGGMGSKANFDHALSVAKAMDIFTSGTYFVDNGRDGYLFTDTDNNGSIDTGIILQGVTQLQNWDLA
jgi:Ca2+-binding RTX toxin-like protein